MKIGSAAEMSGLPAKTIRYYENMGLLTPRRSANGYRDYRDADLDRLVMLKRARCLGISLQQCRKLLALYDTPARASSDIKANAAAWIVEIDRQLEELRALRVELARLIRSSAPDEWPGRPPEIRTQRDRVRGKRLGKHGRP